ncbi:TerC family protein [Pyruvatibacter mobilis]|uniref:TerC family protein n=1 Tax=Pyruvatibacter mobilis TaxID=1712261 RepID=A0A845QBR8_9HYPH|nr:TerC family protein [Pyruvatibacter mobilis]NBG96115.1 TerC family protein [Pyruvatibacter mobilis]QJD75228.1 TerC family protein [Pyruvatibacter mobilis]GGD13820.1 membrane protein [Pyruvatibacter mobilis]
MIDLLASPEAWASLATLAILEIVLGIDNLVFISILADRLPEHQRQRARRIGLAAALGTRILLLFSIVWVMQLTQPLFTLFEHTVSIRDLILIGGGLFLLAKGTLEIHHTVEGEVGETRTKGHAGFASVIMQIAVLDIVFSLDSVITAVGMARDIEIMVAAVVIAVLVMLFAAEAVGGFVARHPTVKMLALSFLLLIGVALVADGLQFHIPKGYLYFAVAFAVGVEMLNLLRTSRRAKQQSQVAKTRA